MTLIKLGRRSLGQTRKNRGSHRRWLFQRFCQAVIVIAIVIVLVFNVLTGAKNEIQNGQSVSVTKSTTATTLPLKMEGFVVDQKAKTKNEGKVSSTTRRSEQQRKEARLDQSPPPPAYKEIAQRGDSRVTTTNNDIKKRREKKKVDDKDLLLSSTSSVERITPAEPGASASLSKPIFVASLPKSGTMFLHEYLECGGGTRMFKSAYRFVKKIGPIGQCMEKNIRYNRNLTAASTTVENGELRRRSPFDGCGNFDVWMETEYYKDYPKPSKCYIPSIQSLQDIYASHPSATIILVTMDPKLWFQTIFKKPTNFILLLKLQEYCSSETSHEANWPKPWSTKEEYYEFYMNHTYMVRNFTSNHPTLTYLEYNLDDEDVHVKLEHDFGISSTECYSKPYNKRNYKQYKDELPSKFRFEIPTLKEGKIKPSPLQVVSKDTLPSNLKIPTPIFVASLPKSATSSTWDYFTCGGINGVHQIINGKIVGKNGRGSKIQIGKVGPCIEQNIINELPPFDHCDDGTGNNEYHVWSDTGYMENHFICYQPAVEALDAIYNAYASEGLTIVLVTRNTSKWWNSLYRVEWLATFGKLSNCKYWPDVRDNATTKEDYWDFYEHHTEYVRNFAKTHPINLTYLEYSVEDPDIAMKMERDIGIDASCWGVKGKTWNKFRKNDPTDQSLLVLNQPERQRGYKRIISAN